jgi:hypothetical protein
MKKKLFTKSAFKIALECPRRLYYAYDSNLYANQDLTDDFLISLAMVFIWEYFYHACRRP